MAKFFRMKCGLAIIAIVLALALPVSVYAEGEEVADDPYNTVLGTGQTVSIGDIADLVLDPSMAYMDAENTRKFLDDNGSISSENDIGAVYPIDDSNWIVYFEYFNEGHIDDEEKNDIDAKALLESYINGTKEQNKKLEDPADHLFVEGWEKAPYYDENERALSWTLRMHTNDNEPLLNQNMRVLTRTGNMSVVLVTDPDHLQADAASMKRLVSSHLTIKAGQRYEDFDESTDKKANYGLTGLILGGAGLVVAKKAGLIAVIVLLVKKFGIVLVAAIVGLGGFLRNKLKRRSNSENTSPDQPSDSSVNANSDRL